MIFKRNKKGGIGKAIRLKIPNLQEIQFWRVYIQVMPFQCSLILIWYPMKRNNMFRVSLHCNSIMQPKRVRVQIWSSRIDLHLIHSSSTLLSSRNRISLDLTFKIATTIALRASQVWPTRPASDHPKSQILSIEKRKRKDRTQPKGKAKATPFHLP